MTMYHMPPYELCPYHRPNIDYSWRYGEADISLEVELPRQQYKPVKLIPIPFDPKLSNSGKFESLNEAMRFIGKHCLFHHQQFKRSLVRHYLPFCRVLDLVKGGYVVPAHIAKRDFDSAFNAACRALGVDR